MSEEKRQEIKYAAVGRYLVTIAENGDLLATRRRDDHNYDFINTTFDEIREWSLNKEDNE